LPLIRLLLHHRLDPGVLIRISRRDCDSRLITLQVASFSAFSIATPRHIDFIPEDSWKRTFFSSLPSNLLVILEYIPALPFAPLFCLACMASLAWASIRWSPVNASAVAVPRM